jgi:hypothetical protein
MHWATRSGLRAIPGSVRQDQGSLTRMSLFRPPSSSTPVSMSAKTGLGISGCSRWETASRFRGEWRQTGVESFRSSNRETLSARGERNASQGQRNSLREEEAQASPSSIRRCSRHKQYQCPSCPAPRCNTVTRPSLQVDAAEYREFTNFGHEISDALVTILQSGRPWWPLAGIAVDTRAAR